MSTNVGDDLNVRGATTLDSTLTVAGTTSLQATTMAGSLQVTGSINATGSITAPSITETSDYRLKDNVEPIQGALECILRLRPVTFVWKYTKDQSSGFIAHEVQEVIPRAVKGEKDAPDHQSVHYTQLIPYLVAAIREQQDMIKELQDELNTLKSL
jgi:hypothetical protein